VRNNLKTKLSLGTSLLFLGLCPSAFAAELVANCDSRVITEKTCVTYLEGGLKSLGCAIQDVKCVLKPWGSDFTKSWICTTHSENCEAFAQTACPSGTYRTLVEGFDVCKKTVTMPTSFQGQCDHENFNHSMTVKSCDQGVEECAKFGGTPDKCINAPGHGDEWALSCRFPSIKTVSQGSSCEELRSKCQLVNSKIGAKGHLISCTVTR
jgi:hypothetical protein